MSIFSRPKEEERRESIFRDNSINKILDQMVSDGELPPSQKVLTAIRENKITAEDAKAKWTAFKKGQDQIVGNEQGEINKPIDQKDVFKDDLNYFAKNENKPTDPPPAQKLAMPGQPPEPEKPFKTIGLTGAIEEQGYIAKKYLSGLSMGLYEPEQDSPSTMASIAGTIANITGFAASAMLGGMALRSVPVIGGAIKSLETGSKAAGAAMQASKVAGEGVKASVFAAKHGKALGALAAEAAPLGFAVGTTKAAIQGEDWKDSFAAGVVDSAVWTAGAALFYPLVAGVGSLAGLRETRKLGKVYKHLSEDEIATRFKGMKADDMLDLLEKVPEGERSEQANKAIIALKKVIVTDPEGGVLPATEFAKTPEISSSVLEAKSKEMVDSIYGDGPLKFMMENNPTLKSMYANKRYVDILSSTDGFLHEQVKNRNSIGDLAALPFLSDADTLASIAAKSAMRRAQRKGIAGVDEDMFTEFFKDPSKANLDPLKQAIPASKDLRQVMGVAPRTFAQGKKGLTDIRVTSEDAAKIVNDHLETYYRAVATDGAISFGDIGKLAASNEIMRTATVMNKNFSRRMVEAHARKLDTNNMVFVKPELKQGVDAKILINATVQDASHDVRLLKSAKEALKSAKTEAAALIEDVGEEEGADMAKEIISTAQKNMKNVSARLASKNKKIRQLESELVGLAPEDLAEIDKLVGEIYAPNKALMGMQTKETTAFLQRFGYQDNPLYVRNGSELAEQLSMMQAAGKDIGFGKVVEGQFKNERWLESLTKPINVTYFAPIVRKIRTHLGYNSPLEVMFNRIKENDVRVKQGYEYYMNELGSTGLAKGTQADKVARRLGKAEITTSSEEFLALTPKKQQQVLDAVGKARVILDELHMVANAERSRMGQKLIAYKANYIPDIHRKEGFFKAVGERLSTTSEDVSSEIGRVGRKGGLNRPDRPDVRQVHMMHQGGKGDYYDGLIESVEGYLKPILNDIHNAHIVRELDAVAGFAPEGVSRVLYYLRKGVEGRGISSLDEATEGVIKKGAEALRRRRAEGLILGNLNVVMQQATSSAMSFAISPRDAIVATAKMFSKEYDEIFKLSRNRQLAAPLEGIDSDKQLLMAAFKDGDGVLDSAKAAYNYYKKFLGYGFRKFDTVARKHAFVTAAERAKREGLMELSIQNGRDPRAALISYADDWADMLHGSFGDLDKPEAMKSALGRAFFQFQSFGMNLATTMIYDLPRMAYKEGAYKVARNLMEAGAAMTVINAACEENGVPAPFDLLMAFPFLSTYKFGNAGLDDAVAEFIKNAGADRSDKKAGAWRGLASATASVAFPGSKQVYKATSAFGRIGTERGELAWKKQDLGAEKVNVPMAMAFGIYPQVARKNRIEEDRKRPGFKKRSEEYVKRKLFK